MEPLLSAGQVPWLSLTVPVRTRLRIRFPRDFLRKYFATNKHKAAYVDTYSIIVNNITQEFSFFYHRVIQAAVFDGGGGGAVWDAITG